MGVDSVLKRYQVVVYGGIVATAAYFQASGIQQLVAGHLVPSSIAKITTGKAKAEPSARAKKSGKEILARNPFDSETGPLDGGQLLSDSDLPSSSKPAEHHDKANPYEDAACVGVRSSLVTAADDTAWSFASLSFNGEDKLRRVGDTLGQFKVEHIGYYQAPDQDLLPRVWLTEPSGRCIVEMGAGDPASVKPSATETTTAPKPKAPSKKEKLMNEVKSKITKIGENKYEVDKTGVELIIQHYTKLAGSLRGKATKEGMRLTGIKQGTILQELGMQTGDMLKSINGYDMSDPDKAVDAYAKLRRAGKLDMAITRDGVPITVEVQIK